MTHLEPFDVGDEQPTHADLSHQFAAAVIEFGFWRKIAGWALCIAVTGGVPAVWGGVDRLLALESRSATKEEMNRFHTEMFSILTDIKVRIARIEERSERLR